MKIYNTDFKRVQAIPEQTIIFPKLLENNAELFRNNYKTFYTHSWTVLHYIRKISELV